jgi:hypothetical protein
MYQEESLGSGYDADDSGDSPTLFSHALPEHFDPLASPVTNKRNIGRSESNSRIDYITGSHMRNHSSTTISDSGISVSTDGPLVSSPDASAIRQRALRVSKKDKLLRILKDLRKNKFSSGHSSRCNNMAFLYRHVRDPLDELLVLSQSSSHTCKMSFVWTELFGCDNKYVVSLSFVLKNRSRRMVSKLIWYLATCKTYLPVIWIIRTILVHCNYLNTPSLKGSDLEATSHLTCMLPNGYR